MIRYIRDFTIIFSQKLMKKRRNYILETYYFIVPAIEIIISVTQKKTI